MRRTKAIAAAVSGYSHATVPVSSGQNHRPLPDAQPENGSWQGAVASGAKAETEDKEGFQSALQAWFEAYEGFLNERTVNEETGGSHYTHKKLRSAYLSLKRNLDDLFTFEAHPALGIHNTTNLLDGRFADLKRKLGCHHGIKMENKVRSIKDYFSSADGGSSFLSNYVVFAISTMGAFEAATFQPL